MTDLERPPLAGEPSSPTGKHVAEGADGVDAAERAVLARRTVRVLMGSQVLGGAGLASGYAAAALLAKDLTGNEALAGVTAAMMPLGGAIAALPLARIMARRGRRPGLRLGYVLAASGTGLAILSAALGFFPILPVAILLLGVGNSSNLAARFAAGDLATDQSRARSIGLLVWATTIGSVIGPSLALGAAKDVASTLGLRDLTGAYLFSVVFFTGAALVVDRLLRPDPLVVAGGLDDEARPKRSATRESVALIRSQPLAKMAVGAMVVAHMTMVGVMTMTPLHMEDGEHELRIIGFVISLHIVGMYAFSPIVGWLTDRIGRLRVIVAGAVVLAVGAELAGHAPPEQANTVFIGLFLIGLGWSCALIAGSTLLTDLFPASQRVGVQGVADLAMTGAGAAAGLAAGGVVAVAGYHELTLIGVVAGALLAVAAVAAILRGGRPTPAAI